MIKIYILTQAYVKYGKVPKCPMCEKKILVGEVFQLVEFGKGTKIRFHIECLKNFSEIVSK